jgi:GrpB-like predicted nucleotidyltransferase (UPF0157 family)
MDDDQILAAAVGEPPRTYREVVLVEYDPQWPALFEQAAEQIRGALPDAALQIHHVGSTSVPGLMAKPLIDINLVVADTTDEEAYFPKLEAAGYVLRVREPDWFELEDVHCACRDQENGDCGECGLGGHDRLGRACEGHRVGRAERHRVRQRDVEVVPQAWRPTFS